MTNWAVLIGINQYWEPARSLKGAVNDAMRMLQWFLNAKECHVPAENIFLLTRPRPDEIPPGVTYRDAIADELLQLIPDVGDIGDKPDVGRLFFHFSGHGITNFEGGGDEQCLVMADFTPKLTNKALKFNAIKDFFKKTGFREQFFFIDACRNLLPWPYEFETGSTTIKRKGNIKQHTVDQFILNSTAPHSKAWEGLLNPTDKPGEEQGAFTGALLDGLNGDGTAKIYDSNDNEYLVKKESLFDYVISKVDARNIYVVKDPVHPVKQHPLKDGEHSKNPLLVKIPVESVKPERLELFVAPDEVWPIAELRISDENQEFEEVFRPPVKGVPLPLPPLQPMRYTLHASAPNHILEGKNPKRRSFAFYESMEMSVRLIPVQPPSPPAPDASFSAGATSAGFDESIDPPSIDEGPTLVVDLESERLSAEPLGGPSQFAPTDSYTVTQSMLHTKFAELVVEADDRFASLEIRDSAGTLLSLGQGCWKSSALKPGFYHVRVVAPEGQYVEEVIELVAGEKETISIEAPEPSPSRLMEEIIEKAGIQEKKTKNILEVSKAASPISSGQPSTILALAAVAANQNAGWGSRLRNLGVKSFSKVADSERSAGLQIIAGAESLREPLSSVRMRLWPREANISEDKNELTLLPAVAGLAEYTGLSKSGAHWLSIEVPGQVSAVFSVYLPPHMITLLVFHRDIEGRTRVFQYHLSMKPDRLADPDAVRRCELIQRFCMNGRFKNGYELAKEQLDSETIDTVGCCIGGYLALMFDDTERLAKAIRKLNQICPNLSDAHVLAGGYHELAGRDEEARASYSGALDRGILIFANGISRLYGGVTRTSVEHSKTALLTKVVNSRVRGLLWSACSVAVELRAGRSFEETLLSSQPPNLQSAA